MRSCSVFAKKSSNHSVFINSQTRSIGLRSGELPGSGTDCSCGTHAKVSPFIGLAYLFFLLGSVQRDQ